MYLDLGTNGQSDNWTKRQMDKVTKDKWTDGKSKKKLLHFQDHRAMKRPENIFWAKKISKTICEDQRSSL